MSVWRPASVCVCVRVCVQSGGLRFGSEQHIPSVISFGASHRPTRSVSGPHSFSLSLFSLLFSSFGGGGQRLLLNTACHHGRNCQCGVVRRGVAQASWTPWLPINTVEEKEEEEEAKKKKKKEGRNRYPKPEPVDGTKSTLRQKREKGEKGLSLSRLAQKEKEPTQHTSVFCTLRRLLQTKDEKIVNWREAQEPNPPEIRSDECVLVCVWREKRQADYTIRRHSSFHLPQRQKRREEKRGEERRAVCEIFNLRARPSPVSWFVFRKSSSPRLPRPSSISGVLLHTSFPPTSPTTPPSPPPHPQSLVWLSQAAVGTAMKTRRATKLV